MFKVFQECYSDCEEVSSREWEQIHEKSASSQLRMTDAPETGAIIRLHFLVPFFSNYMRLECKFMASKINVAESDVDDK